MLSQTVQTSNGVRAGGFARHLHRRPCARLARLAAAPGERELRSRQM
jgi:hypothetical protein